ncbi:protein of unknown function [Nitrospira japonica]|uniref:Uncharacterized protein n=1 Tax=Nitrospira japonica TaxID=1325564 RepID=A0A1W1I5Y4_9BACT|nr:protein of unknown function [Nitrospira japonica]
MEIDWPEGPPTEVDLPAGTYVASYKGYAHRNMFRQSKIQLNFKIVAPSESAGIEVSLFATFPLQGKPPHRSKYFELWSKANGRPPIRGQRMSAGIFEGYWNVRIEWSKPRNGGPGMPIIVELISREAGGPRR